MFQSTVRALLTFGLFAYAGLVTTSQVQAHHPNYGYRTVQSYETRTIPYIIHRTQYDHCGRPHQVAVTRYKTVTVPVQKVGRIGY